MRTFVTSLFVLLAVLYVLARCVPVEPVDRRPGLGLVGAPADPMTETWSALPAGLSEIEVETRTAIGIPHSVTTVLWRDGEHLYVPCKACATKQWPKNVLARPEVRLRVQGRIYPMQMQQVTDTAERDRLLAGAFPEVTPDLWVFRVSPREVQSAR